MGTQQILLIVLSVIIVGIAVAVGMTMFQNQAVTSNRQAVIADLNNFAAQALAYYKTPSSHGGGGHAWSVDDLGTWLGYNYDETNDSLYTDNGGYKITASSDNLTIVGTGTETGSDGDAKVQATLVLTGTSGEVSTTVNN